MSQTCSLEEMKVFNAKLTEGVSVPEGQLNEMIAAVKKQQQSGGKGKKRGGGKYNAAVIHFITLSIMSGASVAAIGTSLYTIEKSGLMSAYKAYMGISEVAMYGCDNAIGIAARQFTGDYLSPYLKCSFNAQQVEAVNQQILLLVKWVYQGILPLIDAASGFSAYGYVYSQVEKYLNENEPPKSCVMPQTGGRKMKKRSQTKKANKSRRHVKGRKMAKSKKVMKKGRSSRGKRVKK